MPSMKELETWLTAGQAAHELGASRQAINKLIRNGRLRAVHVGKDHEGGRGMWAIDPKSIESHKSSTKPHSGRGETSEGVSTSEDFK